MSLEVSTRQIRRVTIIDLRGRITLGDGCGLLRQTVADLLAKGNMNILLNLADVVYIDSAGLGELVGSHVTVTHRGGGLKLLNAQRKVDNLLQIAKLHTIFEIYTDQNLAVLSFDPPGASSTSA